ncbi:MAG TPA: stress response translation initiation inhibitor YciH [Dehalococcoidia bacterium]|nr:stress response translation initiation inhibitor YciH [Dehalococcoidia bacterium]
MKDGRLVYSSETGRVKGQNAPASKPKAQPASGPPDDGFVRISREKGHRGGKTVTVIRGLPERGAGLDARALELKRLCGAGGTLRDGAIEIQGDHRERIAERLRALGYRIKLAGG